MKPNDIYAKLKAKFGDKATDFIETPETEAYITVSPAALKEICLLMRDDKDMQFDYLALLSGVDNKESLGVVYHLFSTVHKHKIALKVVLNREKPSVISVERVWKSANWHERETFDMFGIVFEGHPDLSRILCPEDWVGYPLRKDYVAPAEYNGIDATPNKA